MSLMQHIINEYSYPDNMGFEEMMKFYADAPDDLIRQVEDLINRDQTKDAWRIIQDFLGVNLQGDEFN